jgi:hypothetical protein
MDATVMKKIATSSAVPRRPGNADAESASQTRKWGRRDLTWHEESGVPVLRRGKCGSLLALVIPDQRFEGMYHFVDLRGRQSDMANLTRIKDAAVSVALANLNRPMKTQDSACGVPCSDSMSRGLSAPSIPDWRLSGALKPALAET